MYQPLFFKKGWWKEPPPILNIPERKKFSFFLPILLSYVNGQFLAVACCIIGFVMTFQYQFPIDVYKLVNSNYNITKQSYFVNIKNNFLAINIV